MIVSIWTGPDGACLLTLDAPSIQTDPSDRVDDQSDDHASRPAPRLLDEPGWTEHKIASSVRRVQRVLTSSLSAGQDSGAVQRVSLRPTQCQPSD
jgi:hypothetical protein